MRHGVAYFPAAILGQVEQSAYDKRGSGQKQIPANLIWVSDKREGVYLKDSDDGFYTTRTYKMVRACFTAMIISGRIRV